jgi:tetratricopeptide (TPR) repeat protein/tRNA A-37 threonylcarbamoyl transferase component Bud32
LTAHQRALAERLFAEALALPREEHSAFLAQNCGDDQVQQEVASLLAFASRPPGGITEAIQHAAGALGTPDFGGLRVGPYRLTGRIGQGGMGAVYRAVRDDDQFQKTVAVKMLRFPDGDPAVLERFRRERQILASLEHPHIARLLDGGAWVPPGSAEPQPYIVMEFVDGVPLTFYCEQHKLPTGLRLALFRQICDALSYAHRQLVVHRDVKPGNILVRPDGNPKLLDFGVSKLLDPGIGAGAATLTRTGFLAMTPDYASPEQVRGEPVSTLTDVYSLGAVLYELLTGRRPHQLTTNDPLEIAREICEREVGAPGVDGELDLVVLKALHREPARRYQSVEQFSEDIRRNLEGLPIIARSDTLGYRAAKFIRRHRLEVGAAATLFVALVGGIAVSTWEARRADAEAATVKAVNEFLQDDLLAQAGASAQSGPNTKPDPHLEVRTALDRAAARIGGKFAKQPLVEASIRQTLGDAYQDLGLYPEAQHHMERALELRRRFRGGKDRDTMQSMYSLGELFSLQGKDAQAVAPLRNALEMQRRVLGAEHTDTLNTIRELARVYSQLGKYAEAEPLFTKALEGQRHVLGENHIDTAETMNDLGVLYQREGRYAQAEPLEARALEISRQLKGEEDTDTLAEMVNLAITYIYENKYEQGAPLLTKVLEVHRRVLGQEHPQTLLSMYMLAGLYRDLGKFQQAEALYLTSQEVRRRVLGEEHPQTLQGAFNLAQLYRSEGKYAQAEVLYTRTLEAYRRVRGPEHPDSLTVMFSLAELYRRQGKYEQAERLAGDVLGVQRRVLGTRHRDTLVTVILLGRARVEEQRYADAESPLREALTGYEKTYPDDWRGFLAQNLLGAALAGQRKYAEAEPPLVAGYEGLLQREAKIPADTKSAVQQAGERIVQLYSDWGKPHEASSWRERLRPPPASPRKE